MDKNECQCPQSCFLHFYLSKKVHSNLIKRVNALSRAFFISTDNLRSVGFFEGMCQCPQSCFLHFYREEAKEILKRRLRCQCPQSCFLHFYCHFRLLPRSTMFCVNALSRAFFISTSSSTQRDTSSIPCQCPQSCFLHFYLKILSMNM